MQSIRDHSFHLDSPDQSISWKEQVFLMFCTLSVYIWDTCDVSHSFVGGVVAFPFLSCLLRYHGPVVDLDSPTTLVGFTAKA